MLSFFSHTSCFWNSLLASCLSVNYDLQNFKCNVSSNLVLLLSTSVSFTLGNPLHPSGFIALLGGKMFKKKKIWVQMGHDNLLCLEQPNWYLHWLSRCQSTSAVSRNISITSKCGGATYHYPYILLSYGF